MSEDNYLTALFCGDFATCRRWYDVEPNDKVFGDLQSIIQNADLAFVNLETPATNIGKPIQKDGPNLNTKPEWLKPLKDIGFNLIGLANNHMGDYGPESVVDCIENCNRIGFSTVGAGKYLEEAQRIYYFEKKEVKLAVIAVCEHEYGIAEVNKAGTAPLDVIDNLRQIQEAKQNADFVIITIHGGNEYFPYPRPGLRKQCLFYIEQGCDAIICHHPHVPGGYEIFKGKPIFYSLGNFIFDSLDLNSKKEGWNEGYVVKLNFEITSKNITYEILPYTQSFEQGGIKLLRNEEKNSFLLRLENYKKVLAKIDEYNQKWNEFCSLKNIDYLSIQYLPFIFKGMGRFLRLWRAENVLLKNTKRLTSRLNLIRCESHREVLVYLLNNILCMRK